MPTFFTFLLVNFTNRGLEPSILCHSGCYGGRFLRFFAKIFLTASSERSKSAARHAYSCITGMVPYICAAAWRMRSWRLRVVSFMMMFCCCNDATKMNGDLDVRIRCGRNGQRKGFVEGQDLSGGVVAVQVEIGRGIVVGFQKGLQELQTGDADVGNMEFVLRKPGTGEDEAPMTVRRNNSFGLPFGEIAFFGLCDIISEAATERAGKGLALLG